MRAKKRTIFPSSQIRQQPINQICEVITHQQLFCNNFQLRVHDIYRRNEM